MAEASADGKLMNVAILGLGHLGLPMAALYANSSHKVIGVDTNTDLLDTLQSGTFHTDEPEVASLIEQAGANLTYAPLAYEAVLKSEFVFVVVPTPSKADGTFTSEYVVTTCRQIGVALHDKNQYTLVVIVSTLMPGQMDADVLPALEQTSGKKCGVDFGLCYSPEFIALGRVVEGLRNPDYILIGCRDKMEHSGRLGDFYFTICPNLPTVRAISFVNAELAKLATNAYLSLKIAYANVLGQICETLPGANVDTVTQAVGADHRIDGAFLRAGLPAGGVCLPRDVAALHQVIRHRYADDRLIEALEVGNREFIRDIVRLIDNSIDRASRVVVLGTGYSATTSIQIESPGRMIADGLGEQGHHIWTDYINTDGAQILVDQFEVIVIAQPLDSYKSLTFHAEQMVFDIWRILDPAHMPGGVTLHQFGVGAKVEAHG